MQPETRGREAFTLLDGGGAGGCASSPTPIVHVSHAIIYDIVAAL